MIRFITACIVVATIATVSGTAREFTSSTGQKLQAEVVFITGETVTLERSDGKSFSVPVDRFSEADQAYFNQWKEENRGKVPEHLKDKLPRMTMRVSNGKTSKADDNFSGYVDENKQKVKITVTMENNDAIYPIVDAKLSMLVFGESPENGKNVVVYKEQFSDIELLLNEPKEYQGKGFELWYDDEGAMYGFKYKGYLVYLEDPEGKMLHVTSIPSTAAKYVQGAKELVAGDVYNRAYQKDGTASLSQAVKNMK